MKKYLLWIVVMAIFMGLTPVFGETGTADKNVDRSPLKVTFIGGSSSGIWYMVLNGVTICINKSFPGSVVTVVPGSGLANITRINSHQADGSLVNSTISAWALEGHEPFKEKLTNIASVASLYPSQFQMVVDKKLGVKSLDEIISKKMKIRLSVDTPGSNATLTFNRILHEYGVTVDDFEKWGGKIINKNMDDSAAMFADGSIDGFCLLTLYPAAPIQEAAVNREIVMLPIKESIMDTLVEKYGYSRSTIPSNAYKFSTKDIPTLASYTVVLVPKDGDDEIAYKIARSIHENLGYLRTIHSALKDLTPEELAQNLGVPLHPGAKKYYQEAGILKKDK